MTLKTIKACPTSVERARIALDESGGLAAERFQHTDWI
jgi:hypothetical protein